MERISFYDQIQSNKRKSVFLMLFVAIIIILIGYGISFLFPTEYVFFILIISIVLGIIWPWIGYYNSGKMAIWSVGAVKADKYHHRQYYSIVEGLTIASGIPMPQLYVMKGNQINAFASGRDPKNAVICVTEGCLQKLSKQELEGVLAHEMSHIANFDIRFMTLTTILVGIISIMAEIFLRSLWFSDRDNGGKNGWIIILIGVFLAILAPIVTTLVQLAISRKREYVADATAVKMTRTPSGLIGALEKIKNDKAEIKVSGSLSPLFFTKPKASAVELFQTHPDINKRIEILKKM